MFVLATSVGTGCGSERAQDATASEDPGVSAAPIEPEGARRWSTAIVLDPTVFRPGDTESLSDLHSQWSELGSDLADSAQTGELVSFFIIGAQYSEVVRETHEVQFDSHRNGVQVQRVELRDKFEQVWGLFVSRWNHYHEKERYTDSASCILTALWSVSRSGWTGCGTERRCELILFSDLVESCEGSRIQLEGCDTTPPKIGEGLEIVPPEVYDFDLEGFESLRVARLDHKCVTDVTSIVHLENAWERLATDHLKVEAKIRDRVVVDH